MKPAVTRQPNMQTSTSSTPRQIDGHSNNVMAKRLLWLAIGLGVAYVAIKEIPDGRRFLRFKRM